MIVEVYVPVAVRLKDGKPIEASVDPSGAPYIYAGTNEIEEAWVPAREKWRAPTASERSTAETFLTEMLMP